MNISTVLSWIFITPFIMGLNCSKLPDFQGLISSSRMKRDDDYDVKCHQSGTGLFSFFAVPILLGDITLDFMSMVDVMVDVMVMATGTEAEDGGTTNNNNNNGMAMSSTSDGSTSNNNNNNNMNMRRKKRKIAVDRREVIDSVLNTFEESKHSNVTLINKYENQAKLHAVEYLKLLEAKTEPGKNNQVIGRRRAKPKKKHVADILAVEFMNNLMSSFDNFKQFCQEHGEKEPDCAILDTDWNSVLGSVW